ncbi:oligosaccharide flippase family protein [Marinobacter sp.]|uniref:oligosaccharide flippase family protein n=1 Tax=Marinobacter sp. TaxID=50741 RepID=UPI00384B9BA3
MTAPSVRKAIIYSSGARYVITFLGLASTMLVSRLLTPEEIGTFAVASAIVMIMSEFRMLGAGGYLVRESEITEDKVRSALGLTVLVSWGLGLLILAFAFPISIFYNLPPLAAIFAILSISFFLAPYMSIPAALLSRKMDFRRQFKVQFFSSLAGFITTIALILAGASYYALAFGQTVIAAVSFVLFSSMKPEGMVWIPRFRGIGEVASFGIFTSLASVFRRLIVTVPDMIIGKMGTTTQVGMFSRGLGFIQFVSTTIVMGIKPVVLPYLSNINRSGGDLNTAYTRASVMLGGITWPVLAVASVVSLPAIRIFFGDQWDAAAPPAAMLAFWAMFRVIHLFSSDLFTALKMEKMLALKEGLIFISYAGGIILAFPSGLFAIAGVFVAISALDLLVTTMLLFRYAGLAPIRFFGSWFKNVILTLVCWAAAWTIYNMAGSDSFGIIAALILVAMTLPFVWLIGIIILDHPLKAEIRGVFMWLRKRGSAE